MYARRMNTQVAARNPKGNGRKVVVCFFRLLSFIFLSQSHTQAVSVRGSSIQQGKCQYPDNLTHQLPPWSPTMRLKVTHAHICQAALHCPPEKAISHKSKLCLFEAHHILPGRSMEGTSPVQTFWHLCSKHAYAAQD